MANPRIVASAFSGFVVGVLATLLLTGTLFSGSSSPPPVTPVAPPATPIPESALQVAVDRIVMRQLGVEGPTGKGSRLLRPVILTAAGPIRPAPNLNGRIVPFHSVRIDFHLYDHPLGRTWRLRTAKSDVFGVLKSLYTSRLGIYDVEMDGWFPLRSGKAKTLQTCLIARMDHRVAESIPWKRWARTVENEGRVWAELSVRYVNPAFA